MNRIERFGSALEILFLSLIVITGCTSKYSRKSTPVVNAVAENPLNDSLGVRRPASEYFPKNWEGGEMPSGFWYTVPPDLEDSLAKVDSMFRKYLDYKNEVQRKHRENKSDSLDSAETDTTEMP